MFAVFPVADPESGPGLESSAASDVFACEHAVDSPAAESEATSLLPDEAGRLSRTQHGRDAVGVEPSVVYNDWEKGMKLLLVVFIYPYCIVCLGFLFVFLSRWLI